MHKVVVVPDARGLRQQIDRPGVDEESSRSAVPDGRDTRQSPFDRRIYFPITPSHHLLPRRAADIHQVAAVQRRSAGMNSARKSDSMPLLLWLPGELIYLPIPSGGHCQ